MDDVALGVEHSALVQRAPAKFQDPFLDGLNVFDPKSQERRILTLDS